MEISGIDTNGRYFYIGINKETPMIVQQREVQWMFLRDDDGAWHWTFCSLDGTSSGRSRHSFATLMACISDAHEHGFSRHFFSAEEHDLVDAL